MPARCRNGYRAERCCCSGQRISDQRFPWRQRIKPRRMNRSFSFYLLLFMVVLVICIVGLLTVNAYLYTKDTFDRESRNLGIQTEKNVEEAIRLTDAATTILDNSMNDRMQEGLSRSMPSMSVPDATLLG